MTNKVTCCQIRDILETREPDEVWIDFVKWVETLIPFWREAVITISDLTDFDSKKRDKHLAIIDNSLQLMNDWRFNKIKYVAARRNEIDSAISFIRNNALNKKISKFIFGPMCRNVASILRGALYLSTRGYSDEQMPTVIAQDVFQFAGIYLYFPIDESNFITFLPADKSIHTKDKNDLDNYHLMLEAAGEKLHLQDFIQNIHEKGYEIWGNFQSPTPWNYPDTIWGVEIEDISNELYYDTIKAFYQKQ